MLPSTLHSLFQAEELNQDGSRSLGTGQGGVKRCSAQACSSAVAAAVLGQTTQTTLVPVFRTNSTPRAPKQPLDFHNLRLPSTAISMFINKVENASVHLTRSKFVSKRPRRSR